MTADDESSMSGPSASGDEAIAAAAERSKLTAARKLPTFGDLPLPADTANLREGVNLTRITLPIRVFEPRSFLQRLTDNWAYVHLLEQAADAADPAERLRYLVHDPPQLYWP